MERQDCWQFMKCGREAKCPAYPEHGRDCFAVTGTTCGGETQGAYVDKIENCRTGCEFYKRVMDGLI